MCSERNTTPAGHMLSSTGIATAGSLPDGRAGALRWGGLALGAAAALGFATWFSLQAALSVVIVALVGTIHLRSRWAGLMSLMSLWLVAPLLRRLLDLIEGSTGPDLLALAPFVATAVVGLIDFSRHPLSPRARLVLCAALAAFLIGIPQGIKDPNPLTFGFVAYLAGLSGFLIGYAEEPRRGEAPQLSRVLLLLVPPVALYGLYQALFPLPVWDAHWLEATGNPTFGTKQGGDFRAFATLNAPFTLGAVLAVFAAICLAVRKLTPYVLIVSAVALACLALTYVRSAWVGLAFAMLLTVAVGRKRYAARVAIVATIVVGLVLAAGPRSTIGAQVIERAQTLSSLGQDVSAQSRLRTTSEVLPVALKAPVGEGIGAVGQARVISDVPERKGFPDNGYLAILFQLGPVGFLMLFGALLTCAVWAARARLDRDLRALRVSAGVALGTLLCLQFSVDILYGITGPMVWYFAGHLVRISDEGRGLQPVVPRS